MSDDAFAAQADAGAIVQREPTLVLWNRSAGRAEEALPIARQLRLEAGVQFHETTSRDDARENASRAWDDGFGHVVVAGGDGTVNSVVNGLMQSPQRPRLSVLPIGTANDFACSLGIPWELEAAAETVSAGRTAAIDVVKISGEDVTQWFVNVAAGGNSDEVTRRLTPEMKSRWGPLCYFRGALGVLPELKTFRARVQFDDEEAESCELWNLIIANGRTNAGRIEVAPRASLTDGMLDVILIEEGNWIDLSTLVVQYVIGDYITAEGVQYRHARRVRLHAEPPLRFSVDGEVLETHPVHFEVVPGAIEMTIGPHAGC